MHYDSLFLLVDKQSQVVHSDWNPDIYLPLSLTHPFLAFEILNRSLQGKDDGRKMGIMGKVRFDDRTCILSHSMHANGNVD
ncbi:hypothetical protein SLEP1_g8296 [Rubroshorea leprosula]|uniref:Uncharacterized protein n=1 Tax=Rubroshorea leprosula TaxID=152421 RepID=A0AAV5I950_9ROSI|nr:hypothetical protein SLEP1_g8296 [Rubroshorea leprosula]